MSNFLTMPQWDKFCSLVAKTTNRKEWTNLNQAVREYIDNPSNGIFNLSNKLDIFIKVKSINPGQIFKTDRNKFNMIWAIKEYVSESKYYNAISASPIGVNMTDVLSSICKYAEIQYKKDIEKKWKEDIKKSFNEIINSPLVQGVGQSIFAVAKSTQIGQVYEVYKVYKAAILLHNIDSKSGQTQDESSAGNKSSPPTLEEVKAQLKVYIETCTNEILIAAKESYISKLDIAGLKFAICNDFWNQIQDFTFETQMSMIPYLGLVFDGIKVGKNIKKVSKAIVQVLAVRTTTDFLQPTNQDVVGCLDSVEQLLKQIAIEEIASASLSSVKLGIGIAAAVGTGGLDIASTVVGLTASSVKFLYLLSGFVLTYFAKAEANRLLLIGDIVSIRKAMGIFPLLGAHVIVKLYPEDIDTEDYESAKNIFFLFDIKEQLKEPFGGPLIQLYQDVTKDIKKNSIAILQKSHFEVKSPISIFKKLKIDWRKIYIIRMQKSLFFNKALEIAENHDLAVSIDLALKEYKKQIGSGSSFFGIRIYGGGGGNVNFLGNSFQSQESKKAVEILESNLCSSKFLLQIKNINTYINDLKHKDQLTAAYLWEAKLYVINGVNTTSDLFNSCLIESGYFLGLVKFLLNRGSSDPSNFIAPRNLGRLKQGSRLYGLINDAYTKWFLNVNNKRQMYNNRGFIVALRDEPS